MSGNWGPLFHEDSTERVRGPELVNYHGIPITERARLAGLSYDASRFTVPERQCEVHVVSYIYRGPLNLRIWEERDPISQQLIVIKNYTDNYEQTRTIWMDGRPHPSPSAPHTWMGLSTGKWGGNILTVQITHIKRGWLRRNGLRASDQATLTEPFIRTEDFVPRSLNGEAWLYPCDDVVEIERPRGAVPNYLPGQNPFVSEFANRYKIPVEAALFVSSIFRFSRAGLVRSRGPAVLIVDSGVEEEI